MELQSVTILWFQEHLLLKVPVFPGVSGLLIQVTALLVTVEVILQCISGEYRCTNKV